MSVPSNRGVGRSVPRMSQMIRSQSILGTPYRRTNLDFEWSDYVRQARVPRRGTEGLGAPKVCYLKDRTPFEKYPAKFTLDIEEDVEYIRKMGFTIDYPDGRLGSGLFSVVYRGYYGSSIEDFTRVKAERRFAVKVIDLKRGGYSNSDRENFESEKYILTKVFHKNLVSIKMIINMGDHHLKRFEDYPNKRYTSPDRIYLIMNYADQGPLEDFLKKENYSAIQPETRIKFIRDLYWGMHYLHQNGILHADVHIGNALVFTEYDELIAKWSDFGLSQIVTKKRVNRISGSYFQEEVPFDIIGMTTIFDNILANRNLGRFETQEEKQQLDECQRMVNTCRNVETLEEFSPFLHVLQDELFFDEQHYA